MLWLRSAFFTVLMPGSVLIWIPAWLSTLEGDRFDLHVARWVGLPLVVAGASALLWCIWNFGRSGRGTLAPLDPPRFVVRGGLFRHVRNPMYVAVLTALVGETVLFESARIAVWAAVVATAFVVWVRAYEEPTLRRRFGADYDAYAMTVPRWLPRCRPAVSRANQPAS